MGVAMAGVSCGDGPETVHATASTETITGTRRQRISWIVAECLDRLNSSRSNSVYGLAILCIGPSMGIITVLEQL